MKNLKILPIFYIIFFVVFTSCNHHSNGKIKKYPKSRYATPAKISNDLIINKPLKNSIVAFKAPFVQKKLIVVDPGHGGDDFGTKSLTKPKYHEKSLNLTTALILSDFLQKMGYQTLMTRSKDEFISLQRRAEIANEVGADLFLSVHYNSAPSKEADGIEVFYFKSEDNKARMNESKKLATAILNKVIRNTDAKSRGVKSANFAVIRETKMPAILIEGGFLTNSSELEKIKDPAYVKSLAWGIAQGVQVYFNN